MSGADSLVVQKFGTKKEDNSSETAPVGEETIMVDPYKKLKLTKNPDGSFIREPLFPLAPVKPLRLNSGDGDSISCDEEKKVKTVSKDVTLNEEKRTWIRIHRPEYCAPGEKLPLMLYFHGGGFIICTADSAPFDTYCSQVAAELPGVVATVEYRSAPEHRLPAAYDDAVEALEWLRDNISNDEWLRVYADPARCFLHGSSAGGNIVYHLAVRAQQLQLGQLVIGGLIFNQPFFGGSGRTESELRYIDPLIPLPVIDLMWELALPVGSDQDHKYCNPMGSVHDEEELKLLRLLPKCFVIGYECDPLVDRQKPFAQMLEGFGVNVATRFHEGGHHGVEFFDDLKYQELLQEVLDFILHQTPSSTS